MSTMRLSGYIHISTNNMQVLSRRVSHLIVIAADH